MLTCLFYSLSSAAAGGFIGIIKGGQFLSLTLMNSFLISYYFTIKTKSFKILLGSSLLFILAYISQPTRMFPLFGFIIIIELFIILKNGFKKVKLAILRLLFYFTPIIILISFAPLHPYWKNATYFPLLNGNFHLLLTPIGSIGNITMESFFNFGSYILFIFSGPFFIFFFTSIILGVILSNKPIFFFFKAITLNLFLEILIFL
ncbi:hypothetical protein HYZ05_02975 [Candidatus Daviesbacteria bacterium]|nr:hypothetical protein [Candidatus Daviesbacteria bacterium]